MLPKSRALFAYVVSASLAAHAAILCAAPSARSQQAGAAIEDATVDVDLEASPWPAETLPESPKAPDRATEPPPVPAPRRPVVTREASLVRSSHAATAPASAPEAPAIAAESTDVPPRFVLAVGLSTTARTAPATTASTAPPGSDALPAAVGGESKPARLARGGSPPYPPDARRAGVEADVPVEILVSETGSVEQARALAHPGYGLEDAAVDAVRRYVFAPALKDGHAVATRLRWTVQFRLW